MNSIYNRFVELIGRDIESESESKDLIVLIRIQTIVDFVYSLLLCVTFFSWFDAESGILAIVFGILHLLVLYLTYKRSTRQALFLYCILVALSTLYYCVHVSPGLGFRYVIFAIIPLIYFKTDESWGFRISWSALSAVFSIALAITGLYVSTSWIIPVRIKIFFIILTTLALAIKLMIISHFYYKKFANDESKIIKYAQKLEILSNQDPLTKLTNRRGMEKYLERKINNLSMESALTIVMVDIDYFKLVNDTYGHEAGDYVLKTLATLMTNFIGDNGRVARWGGEEFLIVFEENGDEAFIKSEDLRRQIELASFEFDDHELSITATFGVEEFSPSAPIEESIEAADQKLYAGKSAGRNRVIY